MTTPRERQRAFPFEGVLPLADSGYNAAIMQVPMPPRIRSLKISMRGYPIPWFVQYVDGQPDFRVFDVAKMQAAWQRKLCWVCGTPLGKYYAMTLGPMCTVNRTISEPASHRDCALYSVFACPFLANPRMRRNTNEMPAGHRDAPGIALARNPGAMAIWITRGYRPFNVPKEHGGGSLFTFDDPEEVLWFKEGRPATHNDVTAAIGSGLPALEEIAKTEPGGMAALRKNIEATERYLPDPLTGAQFHHLRRRSP